MMIETAVKGHVRGQARLVALCDGPYKLMLDRRYDLSVLYDLKTDPHERTDISKRMPERVVSMKRAIRQFMRKRRAAVTRPHRPLTATDKEILKRLGYLDPGRQESQPGRPGR